MYLKVYFILAHKDPEQLKELISLLQDDKSLFFIHIDKKENQKKYENSICSTNCYFLKNRIVCKWGKYSLVQATLNGMREVQDFMNNQHIDADYHFIMLSGDDLPLKTNSYIHCFLEKNSKTSFLHHWQLPYAKWWGGGWFRLENVYFFEHKKCRKFNYWLNRLIKKARLHFLLPMHQFKKTFPDFKIFGSSQWMILNKDLVAFVLQNNKSNSKFSRVFKNSFAPDELYFSSLIINYDVHKQFRINNFATHLVSFNGLESSPKYLTINDLINDNENILFGRKFDSNVNIEAVTYVKQIILK
ncbi:beta-1,6-N-acetylglucosaminyltransferase [Flavobacterium sp. Arc3]|uniref:beta-1,6-N-acetylglucosaminyltransferase n=1 Tax=Flavobacterium sp. Arc3 TaxID=3046686 RepID=UPI00352E762C